MEDSEPLTHTQHLLTPLRESIVDKPPCTSGTLRLPTSCFLLFYEEKKDGNNTRHINLANATHDELEQLTRACDPVSFGLEKKVMLDEGTQSSKYIAAELHELNVYSKGSFFKPHIDPPRSQKMFGSLVIVFPTPHEGGALLLRHRGQEWAFESGQGLTTAHEPFISYIAFFSDVEHEVAQVTSGHRVTLTYNLYFDDGGRTVSSGGTTSEHVSLPLAVNENAFRTAFQALLENPEFLEDGGTLAFGMRHVYPILDATKYTSPLEPIYGALKGSDAVVYQTAHALGFQPVLCMYYQIEYPVYPDSGDPGTTASGTVIDFSSRGWLEEENVDVVSMMLHHDGIAVHQEDWWSHYVDFEQVEWVTPVMTLNRKTSPFVSGGRRSSLGLAYADLCMFVSIGAGG